MDKSIWTGRVDHEDGALGQRWHQVVTEVTETPGICLIGFATDTGVAANKGRVGASEGPDAIRKQLAQLPATLSKEIYDLGNTSVENANLTQAQQAVANQITSSLQAGHFPILLGGGHEIGFASYLGLRQHSPTQRIGIINLDAHLDLRKPSPLPSSGTPFYQAAMDCKERGVNFDYLCLGAAKTANTPALFTRAEELGAEVVFDTQLQQLDRTIFQQIEMFIDRVDRVYLTIDLDVLPGYQMPGVSAVAAMGVPLHIITSLVKFIASSDKIALMDIAELAPCYDRDQLSAKTAARIIFDALESHASVTES